MSLADHLAVAVKQNANSVDGTWSAFSGGPATTVRGAFFKPGAVVMGVEANLPRFDCMIADLPRAPRHDDRVTIAGERYRVKGVEKDPVGGVVSLSLELVA